MNYPIIITGDEFPAITQPGIQIRINAEPWTAKHLGKTFRTVDAEWFFRETWRPIPRNSKQAIDIAALIDAGKIQDEAPVGDHMTAFSAHINAGGNLRDWLDAEAKRIDAQNVAAFEVQMQQASGKLFL